MPASVGPLTIMAAVEDYRGGVIYQKGLHEAGKGRCRAEIGATQRDTEKYTSGAPLSHHGSRPECRGLHALGQRNYFRLISAVVVPQFPVATLVSEICFSMFATS